MTFWAASGFLWQHLASFIKNKIKQSKNKAICYHNLVFTVLKEQRVASSQKIHKGRCFTFIKGQRDSRFFSELNLPVLQIPCKVGIIYWKQNTHLVPNLMSLTAQGQALILSNPPVKTTPASPTKISWTPLTMDWNPDPQSLLTVNAGISVRNPARSETCLKLN